MERGDESFATPECSRMCLRGQGCSCKICGVHCSHTYLNLLSAIRLHQAGLKHLKAAPSYLRLVFRANCVMFPRMPMIGRVCGVILPEPRRRNDSGGKCQGRHVFVESVLISSILGLYIHAKKIHEHRFYRRRDNGCVPRFHRRVVLLHSTLFALSTPKISGKWRTKSA